jgi:hypothetical protein
MFMKKTLLGSLVLLSLFSCKKDVTELPSVTQTGANTFGAKVNGQFWVPKGFGAIPANDILEVRRTGPTSIVINARNFASSPNESEFEISVPDITGPGTYLLNTDVSRPSPAGYGYYVKRKVDPENEWLTSSSYTGSVTITRYDTVNLIVAGTFEFNAINLYNTPQPLSVTEGRFDLKMQ